MLQFVTTPTPRFTPRQQVEMAISAGVAWVQLSAPAGELRAEAEAVIPLCRERGTILVIADDVELVKELRVHGVHLNAGNPVSPAAAREELGPHAIIGCSVTSADDIMALAGADIDYVTVDQSILDRVAHEAQERRNRIPIVASGDVNLLNLLPLIHHGASGVEIGASAMAVPDPEAFLAHALDQLAQ